MRNEIFYEWVIEEIDAESGDVVENHFFDELSNVTTPIPEGSAFGLIKKVGNDAEGEVNRFYAYVKDGRLPECFSDETGRALPWVKVPIKYRNQIVRLLNK